MQGAPHKAQALIFDMDGTMVDSMPWHAKAWIEYGRRKAAVAHGYKIAVGTAGDRHNIAFTMSQLKMDPPPLAVVGGDEGGPHVIAAVRDHNELTKSNFLETLDALA